MIRFILIVVLVFCFSFTLSHIWPASAGAAFVLGGIGFSWAFLACIGIGGLTFKLTGK